MFSKEIPKEHKKCLDAVLNYILKNLNEDLSLEILAQEANYSPFHLQKLFKQVMGESPKQYITRMRLETAAHYLIVFQHKSITEVSYDCGFSSPAVFARAFKNYFGISAEKMRLATHQEQLILRKDSFHLKGMIHEKKIVYTHGNKKKTLQVEVKKMPAITGIFRHTTLKDEAQIQQSFSEIIRFADTHDLLTIDSQVMGLLYPTQDRYTTCIRILPEQLLPKKTETLSIQGGKYAVFRVKGTVVDTFQTLRVFHDQWLPESGYAIAQLFGFELFVKNPSRIAYSKLEREVYVPIEPV